MTENTIPGTDNRQAEGKSIIEKGSKNLSSGLEGYAIGIKESVAKTSRELYNILKRGYTGKIMLHCSSGIIKFYSYDKRVNIH